MRAEKFPVFDEIPATGVFFGKHAKCCAVMIFQTGTLGDRYSFFL